MSLKRNVIGLTTAQVFNYIVPLIQFPYLTRVLGVEKFGLVMFALALISMMQVITNYGFDISLNKKISDRKRSNRKIGSYLYQAVVVKIFLMFFAIAISILIIINSELSVSFELSFFLIITVFFNSFDMVWLFQGVEKGYVYARIVIISRGFLLLMVILFIKDESDYFLYTMLLSLSSLFIILMSFFVIYKWSIKLVKTKTYKSLSLLRDSFEFFLSKVCIMLFVSSSVVILGAIGSLTQVALYSSAEKLYQAGIGIFNPVVSPLVPYMNRTKNYQLFYKITLFFLLIGVFGALFGFCFGDDVLVLVFGAEMKVAKDTLDLLMVSLVLNVIGMFFGYPALMPLGKERYANLSVILGGGVHIFVIFFMFFLNIEFTAYRMGIVFCISSFVCTLYRVVIFVKIKNRRSTFGDDAKLLRM